MMKFFKGRNASELSRRDPAAAVLLGRISGENFGYEGRAPKSRFGSDRPQFGHDWGSAVNFGYEAGMQNFGADAPTAPAPTPQNMMVAWQNEMRRMVANQKREILLEPNKGADAKIERYDFAVAQAITIGTALATFTAQANPTVYFRPQRMVNNAPTPFFVMLSNIQVANVNVTVGPGPTDAYAYSAEAVGTTLDLPTLTPSNAARLTGQYTGLIPPGIPNGFATHFSTSFTGWASIVA